MARIDFYILAASGEQARQQFACRLAEKAYRLDHRVHIHVSEPDWLGRMDELLWTFRDGSFVPHEVVSAGAERTEAPVTLGCDENAVQQADLLINLADDVPACAAHLGSQQGTDCMELGCRARRACPVGRAYIYEPAQALFHMSAFLCARSQND